MTYVDLQEGQSGKGNGSMPEADEAHRDAGARAGDARARDDQIVTNSDDETGGHAQQALLEDLIDRWVDEGKRTLNRLWAWLTGDRGLLSEHPASIADLAVYWVRAPLAGASTFLRWVQRIDGFVLGGFGTITGYAWAWLWQRPLRRYCFLLLALIVWRY